MAMEVNNKRATAEHLVVNERQVRDWCKQQYELKIRTRQSVRDCKPPLKLMILISIPVMVYLSGMVYPISGQSS